MAANPIKSSSMNLYIFPFIVEKRRVGKGLFYKKPGQNARAFAVVEQINLQ
jgi:hypothetical protein